MATAGASKLRALLRKNPVIRTRDRTRLGLALAALEAPLVEGAISRISRGVYAVTGHAVSEHHGLAQATGRVPHAVVCLLSALVFHELTTQSPTRFGWPSTGRRAIRRTDFRRRMSSGSAVRRLLPAPRST